jgi:hypothetical protein
MSDSLEKILEFIPISFFTSFIPNQTSIMEQTKTLKRKLDDSTTEITESKVMKREMYVNFRVTLNGIQFKDVRLVLNNDSTFQDVPNLLMPIINKKMKNLGTNQSFECSVNGAILQNEERISKAINPIQEVVEFSLTCDVKLTIIVLLDGTQMKNTSLSVNSDDTYFHLLKNVKEASENRGDFNVKRYRIDINNSSISLNNVTQKKTDLVFKTFPSPNSVFVARLVTQRTSFFDYASSFF